MSRMTRKTIISMKPKSASWSNMTAHGIEEDGLDVEDDEEDGDQVVADREAVVVSAKVSGSLPHS